MTSFRYIYMLWIPVYVCSVWLLTIDEKDLAIESWHDVLESPSWRSCAPPAFLLLPRSRKFHGQFSRPDMDAPQVECLETCKHTKHKTKRASCVLCVCILNFANVQSGHVWTLKIQPNASCHCAHADVQPPESNEKSYKRSVNLWLWKILRKSLCTWKKRAAATLTLSTSLHNLLDQLLQVTWPKILTFTQSDTPVESDSKPPASVHHVALAHGFQDVLRVHSCDSLCLK